MHLKLFEVRDRGTFLPCFAFLTTPGPIFPTNQGERFLLERAGFDPRLPQVVFGKLEELGRTQWDPTAWGDRTLRTAHEYINTNWYALESGDVIDVEYILKEKTEPKVSERFR